MFRGRGDHDDRSLERTHETHLQHYVWIGVSSTPPEGQFAFPGLRAVATTESRPSPLVPEVRWDLVLRMDLMAPGVPAVR